MSRNKKQKKIKIRIKKPWIAYSGSVIQQNYAEQLDHGYLLWDIRDAVDYDVAFNKLPNPRPYMTVQWLGSAQATIEHALTTCPQYSRIRIRSHESLYQKDVVDLTSGLKEKLNATEVIFKTDNDVDRDIVFTGAATVVKDDLRNPDVLLRLLKEYNHSLTVEDDMWASVHELIKTYVSAVPGSEDTARNVKWVLRHLKFDNTFTYGESNVVNFENMNGIVGIFGPNRSGKSSIVGTIMYALFNDTDRGSIKNLHVVNTRKPYCYTRAVINVDSVDYVIERQTVKLENKRGQVNASTALNVFRIDGEEAIDLAGEQRSDTEKVIKKLIGTSDDFLLTSLSAQDELKMFISQGSTRRRQNLSRFLDLDVFEKMYEQAKNELNTTRAVLRTLPDRDWMALDIECYDKIDALSSDIERLDTELHDLHLRLNELRSTLTSHADYTPVTPDQVAAQRARVSQLLSTVAAAESKITELRARGDELTARIDQIVLVQRDYDVDDIKKRIETFRDLSSTLKDLKHSLEKEESTVKLSERSLKILRDVPCGDKFPMCRFIKDAHLAEEKVAAQHIKVTRTLERVNKVQEQLSQYDGSMLIDTLKKIERVNDAMTKLQVELSTTRVELVRLETTHAQSLTQLELAKNKLDELEEALKNDENAEVVSLRLEIDELVRSIKKKDSEKMQAATELGRIQTIMDKHSSERAARSDVLKKMQTYELITGAFSRRGIPAAIIKSQLPVINAELANILHGIVDFTVELESDEESDAMDVYINYGDSRRVIELGSGMEKMIASVAIRVAMINISSLPKTDMFVLDEGFGALDDAGVEACNRLLTSLKRYFKTIIVITHVEGVKDSADIIIEVTKNEKDACVTYA